MTGIEVGREKKVLTTIQETAFAHIIHLWDVKANQVKHSSSEPNLKGEGNEQVHSQRQS